MPTPDDLADELFDGEFPYEYGYEWQPISREHLRTLARQAAKQALLDYADVLTTDSEKLRVAGDTQASYGQVADIAESLRDRAVHIGKGNE